MKDTRLVLLEGIPGSGKSTTAHALQRQLASLSTPHRWWYEGEKGHPLYTFDDGASLDQTVADLFSGDSERVQRVVRGTLDQWRALAAALESRAEVVLFDGMLYGHLGWTMFAGDVPRDAITAYIAGAEAAATRAHACLVYFRPDDVPAAVRRITQRRGERWGDDFVRRITSFPYSRRCGMEGFEGLVRFWQDYRDLEDELFDRSRLVKRRIANDAGNWLGYLREVRDLLELPEPPQSERAAQSRLEAELERFAGTYAFTHNGKERSCQVALEEGSLFLSGVPAIWRQTRLIRDGESGMRFVTESLPFSFVFVADASGAACEMRAEEPDFVWTSIPRHYVRQR